MNLLDPYLLAVSTDNYSEVTDGEKFCKFCRKGENFTQFTMAAHIVPELLGANKFISQNECDECNKLFSRYESHLAILFRPYLTMVGVEGKKGVPGFQSRTEKGDEQTRTSILFIEEKKRQILLASLNDYRIDRDAKRLSLTFRLPPHTPMNVYKSLVKVALSLMAEEETANYSKTILWLLGNSESLCTFALAFVTILQGKKFSKPHASLYKAIKIFDENQFVPEYTLIVSFGNIVVQIFLPLPDNFDYKRSNLHYS